MRKIIVNSFLLMILMATGCGEKSQEEIEKQEQRRAEQQQEQVKKENEELRIKQEMIAAFGNDGYEYLETRSELLQIIGAKNIGFDMAFAGDSSDAEKLSQALQMAQDMEAFANQGLQLQAPPNMEDLDFPTKQAFLFFVSGTTNIIYGTENYNTNQVHQGYAEIDDGMRIIKELNESHPVLMEYRNIKSGRNKTSSPEIKIPPVVKEVPDYFTEYQNDRFQFTISYPENWPNGVESGNGDGMSLYESEGNYIAVYGSYYDPGSEYSPDLQAYSEITLNNGQTAYFHEEDTGGNMTFEMVFLQKDVQYTVYGEVTSNFYQSNRETILHVIRSFEARETED